jgi:hypothetical protein
LRSRSVWARIPHAEVTSARSITRIKACVTTASRTLRHCLAVLILLVTVCSRSGAQRTPPPRLLAGYFPWFCRPAVYPTPSCELVIFREDERRTSVNLPFLLEFLAYASNGTVLYALSASEKPICVSRVELNPVRVTRLVCPVGLAVVFAFTVSSDQTRVLVSGQIKIDNAVRCGIIEMRLADGATKQVLDAGNCRAYNFEHSWTSLSLSPDSYQGIAVRGERLELFQASGGATRSIIANGIEKASWSPDGRWIAALDAHGRTQLIDASDLKIHRTLVGSEVEWSPDSRYLLRIKPCASPAAVNGVGTVQAVDIATGKSLTISSSRCSVDNGSTGWLSRGAFLQTE